MKPNLTKPESSIWQNRAYFYKFRPKYPKAIIDLLIAECGLNQNSVIADIGAGLGFLAQLFSENNNVVFFVEPDNTMRKYGEKYLEKSPNLRIIASTAEATTLPNNSLDFILVGHALHWLDQEKARQEFSRIIKSTGWLVLAWNVPKKCSNQFFKQYKELLLDFGIHYYGVFSIQHFFDPTDLFNKDIPLFFNQGQFELKTFENIQKLNLEEFKGLIQSYSFMPLQGEKNYETMIQEIEKIFNEFKINNTVTLEYTTNIYYGHPTHVNNTSIRE